MAAWRAGAWPMPAETTLPMMTSSMEPGAIPERRTTSFMTIAPSWGAVKPARPPRNLPVGVRTAPAMTGICSDIMNFPLGLETLDLTFTPLWMFASSETCFYSLYLVLRRKVKLWLCRERAHLKTSGYAHIPHGSRYMRGRHQFEGIIHWFSSGTL